MKPEKLDFESHKIRERQRLVDDKIRLELTPCTSAKQRRSVRSKIETIERQLQKLDSLSKYSSQHIILNDLIQGEFNAYAGVYFPADVPRPAGIWSQAASLRLHEKPNRATGDGEIAYRIDAGLPLDKVGSSTNCDVPEQNAEIKWISAVERWNKPTKDRPWSYPTIDVDTFRAGKYSSDHFNETKHEMYIEAVKQGCREGNHTKYLESDSFKKAMCGTFSKSQRLSLPQTVNTVFESRMQPSKSLKSQNMVFSTYIGYLTVSPHQFDEAFEISGVSKGLVSYSLKFEYLQSRLQSLQNK